jgi:hypothetical protein
MSKKINPKTFDKYFSTNDEENKSDIKTPSIILKQNTELFNEEKNTPGAVLRIKRRVKKGEEEWLVMHGKTITLILQASAFSQKQQDFFKTVDGFVFLINGAKEGWDTVEDFQKYVQFRLVD